MTARIIVEHLVARGVIPHEFLEDASSELHEELRRRAKRTSQVLAAMVSTYQVGMVVAERAA